MSGADNGVVRIQQAPAPGQLMGNDDESRYWEVRVVDFDSDMTPILITNNMFVSLSRDTLKQNVEF